LRGWRKRTENDRAWKVPVDQALKYDAEGRLALVNLDVNNPNGKVDLPPFLTQTVKTQNSLNGELSHGIVKQCVQAAAQAPAFLAKKRVGPHTFRHSVGVQLVAAGANATVIRNWFGHARLYTTDLYARANLQIKRKALDQVDAATKPSKPPRWKHDPELIEVARLAVRGAYL
jgi:integrase